MTKVTITVSDLAEGKVLNVTTAPVESIEDEETHAVHTLTAENPTLEVLTDTIAILAVEEDDAEEGSNE